MEYSEQIGFDSDSSTVVFDISANAHIFSEEDMITHKIEPIISNGLATIGGTDILARTILMMRDNCTQINLIMQCTFYTYQ